MGILDVTKSDFWILVLILLVGLRFFLISAWFWQVGLSRALPKEVVFKLTNYRKYVRGQEYLRQAIAALEFTPHKTKRRADETKQEILVKLAVQSNPAKARVALSKAVSSLLGSPFDVTELQKIWTSLPQEKAVGDKFTFRADRQQLVEINQDLELQALTLFRALPVWVKNWEQTAQEVIRVVENLEWMSIGLIIFWSVAVIALKFD